MDALRAKLGTQGATLRFYLETYSGLGGALDLNPQAALEEVKETAWAPGDMQVHIGRTAPDVII